MAGQPAEVPTAGLAFRHGVVVEMLVEQRDAMWMEMQRSSSGHVVVREVEVELV